VLRNRNNTQWVAGVLEPVPRATATWLANNSTLQGFSRPSAVQDRRRWKCRAREHFKTPRRNRHTTVWFVVCAMLALLLGVGYVQVVVLA